jgi:hypothetical protein
MKEYNSYGDVVRHESNWYGVTLVAAVNLKSRLIWGCGPSPLRDSEDRSEIRDTPPSCKGCLKAHRRCQVANIIPFPSKYPINNFYLQYDVSPKEKDYFGGWNLPTSDLDTFFTSPLSHLSAFQPKDYFGDWRLPTSDLDIVFTLQLSQLFEYKTTSTKSLTHSV